MFDRWGDYPTWLAAIGTIAAVVVAITLAGRDTRHRRREDERHQAEQIQAWLLPAGDLSTAGLVLPVIGIVNGSQQLAYRVVASLVPMRGAVSDDFRKVIGRDPTAFRALKGELPPAGQTCRWRIPEAACTFASPSNSHAETRQAGAGCDRPTDS
jgi:hypothetical protein